MALLLPGLRGLTRRANSVVDRATRAAIAGLEDALTDLINRLSKVEAVSGGGSGDVPSTRTISTTSPLSGGGDLSANRTISMSQNSTSAAGYVPQAPNDTDQFWRGDGTWAAPPSSGGSLWSPPATPHADDDEFESTTLDAAWTLTGGTGLTEGGIDPYAAYASGDLLYELHTDRRRSWIMMQPPANNTIHWLTKPITTATNMSWWVRLSYNSRIGTSPANNDFTIGMVLSTSSGTFDPADDRVILTHDADAGVSQFEAGKQVGGVSTTHGLSIDKYVSSMDGQEFEVIGIQKRGTTYDYWLVDGGGKALHLGSTTMSGDINFAGFFVVNNATSSPGTMLMGVDFIRRKDSAVWMP